MLITLTIIGIIASLTIPTLMTKYKKHTYVTGLKKAYSELNNAMKMVPITEGCPSGDYDCAGWDDGGNQGKGTYNAVTNIDGKDFSGSYMGARAKQIYLLSKQFKTQKIALNETDLRKFYSVTPNTSHTGSPKGYHYEQISFNAGFLTDDGMVFMPANSSFGIVVDINGNEGPNKYGRDVFFFAVNCVDYNGIAEGAIIPAGAYANGKIDYACAVYSDTYWNGATKYCSADNNNGTYCTGRVLEEDAMNY